MVFFIRKILLFTLLSFIAFFTLGIIAEKTIESNIKNNQFSLQEDWHIRHKEYNEILFIGNSRTWVFVDAEMITDSIHKKSYCLAQDGRTANVLFWKLKTYLLFNNNPKQIFIQFDPYFVNSTNYGTFYGKQSYLAYIYGDKLKINKLFQSEIGFNKFDVFIPLLRYFNTNYALPILYFHLICSKSSLSDNFKYGSELQIRDWQKSSSYFNPKETNIEILKFNYIDSLINLCKLNKIQPILIYPPQSMTSYNKVSPKIIYQLQNYALTRGLIYWNFNSKKYDDSTFFYNHMHLNYFGAKKYTFQLIDSINTLKSNSTYQGSN